jgi:adenosine deaminase
MSLSPIPLACEILFAHIRPEAVWDGYACRWIINLEKEKKAPNAFLDAAHAHHKLSHHNQEEKSHVLMRAVAELQKPLHPSAPMDTPKGIFRLLLHVVKDYLYDGPGMPLVRYDKMLAWRMLSSAIGQDLPVCAFLAWQDVLAGRERSNFTWPLHLKCDNQALRQRLGKGMAENHYHLWGSVPSFHLTWLRLMGSMQQHERVLKSPLDERLDGDNEAREAEPHLPLEVLSRFAALLRIYLFLKMEPDVAAWKDDIAAIKTLLDQARHQKADMVQAWYADVDAMIAVAKQQLGMAFEDGVVGDYALYKRPGFANLNDGILLAGERMFLYRSYKKIIKGKWTDEECWHFYLYILIKAKIRREYVQLNERVGFYNFKVYQDRKTDFKKGFKDTYNQFLSTWTARFALSRPLAEMPIVSLEARIAPEKTAKDFAKSIRETVEAATQPLRELIRLLPQSGAVPPSEEHRFSRKQQTPESDKFYFVVHFLKAHDKPGKAARHATHRIQLRKQAHALREFRRIDPQWAQYIKGMDAASAEIGCRPEVFAHIFRFLRRDFELDGDIPLENVQHQLSQLRATYHVGEDFLDIIDGLRAIDETMRFLEYRRGDRLGHALALGVAAQAWYAAKHGTVLLPMQDLVDNLAWMHCRLTAIGDARFLALQNRIESDWRKYFMELAAAAHLESKAADYTIEEYAQAWELRGDDPLRYADPSAHPSMQSPTGASADAWSLAGIRLADLGPSQSRIDLVQIRKSARLRWLFHVYHYAEDWKTKGGEIVHYEVDEDYIAAATRLQQHIQFQVRTVGVAIEANPTSNYLIGTFKRYDQHPIPSLYNLGLAHSAAEIDNCPQLSVSINTDDLGIFDTSLENEFALMAVAMEKMKQADGSPRYNHAMIVDWLDRIREAGLGQSFMELERYS